MVTNKAGAGRPRQTPPTGPAGGSQQRFEGMAGHGRAGQPGQLLRGAVRGAIFIKEILGENRGTYI
jgi:hypothetical protein